ncbi:hypothetical protein MVES1_001168 [Malassezia vespertilionis]|uniref:Uncharacterized protein n=1 Tax=Malassezia vespertilionis TaxID=2020962 RepID=A0A2N1JF56_9BASI|nr:uncharacterized protein MVES1_001168 [Malassezia vespertilionis]PKI85146.1 hypothetical protein MVES_001102 [Malassezia vespertilionis]WFD05834.1 hypothetical protein MVES1_001168 [Malassezia vespertilionis]
MSGEGQPLIARGASQSVDVACDTQGFFENAKAHFLALWPSLQLLAVPHLLGLILSAATPSEVDAMRSLSCAHYYYLYPIPGYGQDPNTVDTTSCAAPAVEVHFNSLMTRITFTVVLSNFFGMLLYGRLFKHSNRKWFALMGLLGCALARIPLLFLPLYQYPYLAPYSVRAMSPGTMLWIYWGCSILGGISGAAEIVTLAMESLAVDIQSPEKRSQLFAKFQIAQLLGASMGPMLGSLVNWTFPRMANTCFGYDHCITNNSTNSPQRGAQKYLLFNTASYLLAVVFALLGALWVIFVVNFSTRETSSSMPNCEMCQTEDINRQSKRAVNPPKYAWLGAFQRLLPVRIGRRRYDCRVLQFTFVEICTALMNEGVVVLIFELGFVFHWGRDLIAAGLTISNSLRLFAIAQGLPLLVTFVRTHSKKPASVQHLSNEQLRACIAMSDSDVRRLPNCCPSYQATEESQLLRQVSSDQRTLVRLWRAQVDLYAAQFSYFTNAISWLLIAVGVTIQCEYTVLFGAVLLTAGSGALPMLRSAGCTVTDQIVEEQGSAALPLRQRREQSAAPQAALPDGADSYLVIVSTVLLPCLLIGLIVRNYVYGATIDSFPGTFFIIVAGLNVAAYFTLLFMRPPTKLMRA